MPSMIPQRAEAPSLQRLTLQEIYTAYPDCWVVLGDLDSDPVTLQIFSAVVRGHRKTRREATPAAGELGKALIGWRYPGRPKNRFDVR